MEIHETLYDFANACTACKEPAVSYWRGYSMGYSIASISHKDNCEKKTKDREIQKEIHDTAYKLGYLNF